MMNLVNQARMDDGVHALEVDCGLADYARWRALLQVEWGMLSHDGAVLSETLTSGSSDVRVVFDSLMNSEPHRQLMLDPQYTRSCVGYVDDVFVQVYQ